MFTLSCRVGVVARLGFSLSGDRPRMTSLEFVPTLVRIREGLRAQVVRLERSAAAGVGPAQIRRARALLEGRMPLRLVPPR